MTTFPRRLSVIVSADVVGYNRLIGGDEEGTLATLRKHREAIDSIFIEDGGRIVKTAGDGLLLEFPSAFHAVRASLGAQRVMAERNKDVPPDKRLEFRMGMHLGDVMVNDEDASGDGINIAERLQEIADPGGICLSRAAHAAVHKDFDSMFADGGNKALKDIDAPVHVYNLAPEAAMLSYVPAVTVPRRLLSLMVLPFVNSSGAARHDFLTDSITDQLTSELTRIEDSFVVDRKTALATAAFGDDPAGLGRKLGIRYAIKGGVSTGDAGLRIDAVLIDTETGAAVWNDHLDIAIGDPFVMQHEVNARLVPLVYSRLLAATGHASQLTSAQVPLRHPVTAAQPLAIAPIVVREAAPEPQVTEPPTTEPQAERVATVEIASSTPVPPQAESSAAAPLVSRVDDPVPEAVQAQSEVDALAALVARWPVLRRPLPRRPVKFPPAAAEPPLPLRIIALESLLISPPNVQPGPEFVVQTLVPVAPPGIAAPPEAPAPDLSPAVSLIIATASEIAEPPPVSLLIIEPAPAIGAPEPPTVVPLVIRPRTMVAPKHTERVVSLRPVTESGTVPSRRTAEIIEMPTPPRTDRPEWRMSLWLRLMLLTAVGALGGAIALAKLGFYRETLVAIGSWILIGAGLAQLAGVTAETVRSAHLLRPAGPAWVAPQRVKGPKRVRAKVISVRAVLRSPRGTSRSKRYAP